MLHEYTVSPLFSTIVLPFPYAPISVLFLKYLASDLGLPTMGNEKALTEEAARSAYVIAPLSRPSVQNGPPPTSLMSKVRKRKGESKQFSSSPWVPYVLGVWSKSAGVSIMGDSPLLDLHHGCADYKGHSFIK